MPKLFDLSPEGFAWATGIEDTFVAQTERLGERVLDEYALTHHYLYWREDLDRAASLGVKAMRYGIPWYKVEPEKGRFDWDWSDRALEYAAAKGITVVADLVHYGTPLWLDNQFVNSAYPERVADFAYAFADRYRPILSHYTPLNEPRVTFDFCGLRGIWPPYLRGDDGAIKILRAITRGIALTTEAIRAADPNSVIVHVEAAGEVQPGRRELAEEAARWSARTFVTTDLILGKVGDGHPLLGWLLDNGFGDENLAWHRDRPADFEVMGVNYYPEMSVMKLERTAGGVNTTRAAGGVDGLERALRSFATRYGKPVFISETSTNGTIAERGDWLRQSIEAIPRFRASGIPLVGYTWWPLFDLIDWVYRSGARPVEDFITRLGPPRLDPAQVAGFMTTMRWSSLEHLPLEAYLAPMGLYSLEMCFDETFTRIETPLVAAFRDAVAAGDTVVGDVARPA